MIIRTILSLSRRNLAFRAIYMNGPFCSLIQVVEKSGPWVPSRELLEIVYAGIFGGFLINAAAVL